MRVKQTDLLLAERSGEIENKGSGCLRREGEGLWAWAQQLSPASLLTV